MKELQQDKYEAAGMSVKSQSFMEQTIQELDRIVGLLNNNNERLDRISTIAGERSYDDVKPSCGEVQKSPETRKEMISDLIYIIKSRLNTQEDRISEL